MSSYMMMPGARLEVGPHGQLMEQLGFYSLAPGARLLVGPHGQLKEQLGADACCNSCASSCGPCGRTGSLGAVDSNTMIGAVVVGAVGLAAWMLFRSPRRKRRRNPSTFTRKGERMYRHIKAGYRGSPRAREIAARTVYAAAKRGARGLVRK